MWDDKNLLSIVARDPGDYARKLLRVLFTQSEIQSSLIPSQSAHLYHKDILDEERFGVLNSKHI